MNKKEKENIKRIVGEGLSLVLNKLKILKPSAKMDNALKKQAKKLADHFRAELKRLNKKGLKKSGKVKSKRSTNARGTGVAKQKATHK